MAFDGKVKSYEVKSGKLESYKRKGSGYTLRSNCRVFDLISKAGMKFFLKSFHIFDFFKIGERIFFIMSLCKEDLQHVSNASRMRKEKGMNRRRLGGERFIRRIQIFFVFDMTDRILGSMTLLICSD
ncbi:MAG: hypothetical protein ACLRYY_04530 [Anaerobutyricum soehngenii]